MKKLNKKFIVTSMALVALTFSAIPALADPHRTDLYLTAPGGKLASYADSNMGTVYDAIRVSNEIRINGAIDGIGNSKTCTTANYCSTTVIYSSNNYDPNKTYHSSSKHEWKYNGWPAWEEQHRSDYNL